LMPKSNTTNSCINQRKNHLAINFIGLPRLLWYFNISDELLTKYKTNTYIHIPMESRYKRGGF